MKKKIAIGHTSCARPGIGFQWKKVVDVLENSRDKGMSANEKILIKEGGPQK